MHQYFFRSMIKWPQLGPLASPGEVQRKISSIFRRARIKDGILTWDLRLRRHYLAWMGHLARMNEWDPERLMSKVFRWRNLASIREAAKAAKDGHQGHARQVHVWRLETPVEKLFSSPNWTQRASNKQEWAKNLDTWARKM